jgi:16S rRNA processing protein RimM
VDLPGEREWSVIARLGRTRGLKGEIYGEGDWPAAQYAALERVWLRCAEGTLALEGRPLRPVSVAAYKGRLIFRFEGVDSIEAAEPLERLEVVIPREDRPSLAAGEVYLADLIGCAAVHRLTGETIGTVSGWQETGGPLLLELKAANGREGEPLLIPFARGICVEIDPAGRRIVVDPPEGLLELNEAESGA